MAKGKRTNNDL